MTEEQYQTAMQAALSVARQAGEAGEVPVGAVLLDETGTTLAVAGNDRERSGDPTAHAEVLAIREAATIRHNWNLAGTTLVVTLEPCVMCAGVIQAARVSTLVFGAWDEKAGAVGSQYDLLRDRRLPFTTRVITGVMAEQSQQLLRDFFSASRRNESQ